MNFEYSLDKPYCHLSPSLCTKFEPSSAKQFVEDNANCPKRDIPPLPLSTSIISHSLIKRRTRKNQNGKSRPRWCRNRLPYARPESPLRNRPGTRRSGGSEFRGWTGGRVCKGHFSRNQPHAPAYPPDPTSILTLILQDYGPVVLATAVTDSERRQVQILRELDAKRRAGPFWTGTKEDWARIDSMSGRNAVYNPFECANGSGKRGVKRQFKLVDLKTIKLGAFT